METGNNGMLLIQESRSNLELMKKIYQDEYKKIANRENRINRDYFINKWKVRFGTFGCHIGLLFAPKATRKLGNLGVAVGSFITQKIMKYKNKKENEKLQKRKDELTANFINAEGVFKEFAMDKVYLDMENVNELENGRSK